MNNRELFRNAQQLLNIGKHDEAVTAFTRLIKTSGKTEIIYLSRGVAYIKTRQIEKAVEDFTRVLEMNEGNVRAHYFRGIANLISEKIKEALADLDRTIELKPDHGAAYFARGAAHAQGGNYYEAIRNMKKAMSLSEKGSQSLADSFNMFGTQLYRAIAIMEEEGNDRSATLSDDEIIKIKKWLDTRNH